MLSLAVLATVLVGGSLFAPNASAAVPAGKYYTGSYPWGVYLHDKVSCTYLTQRFKGSNFGYGWSISNAEIISEMIRAGFPRNQIANGLNTVWGESILCPFARNDNNGKSLDLGLWQINNKYFPHLHRNYPNMASARQSTQAAYQVFVAGGYSFRLWNATSTESFEARGHASRWMVNEYVKAYGWRSITG